MDPPDRSRSVGDQGTPTSARMPSDAVAIQSSILYPVICARRVAHSSTVDVRYTSEVDRPVEYSYDAPHSIGFLNYPVVYVSERRPTVTRSGYRGASVFTPVSAPIDPHQRPVSRLESIPSVPPSHESRSTRQSCAIAIAPNGSLHVAESFQPILDVVEVLVEALVVIHMRHCAAFDLRLRRSSFRGERVEQHPSVGVFRNRFADAVQ